MRVAGKLKRDARLFRHREVDGWMRQQNARQRRVQPRAPQNLPQRLRVFRFRVMDTDDLQAIEGYLFIVQGPHTGAADGIQKNSAVDKFIVVAGNVINSVSGRKSL